MKHTAALAVVLVLAGCTRAIGGTPTIQPQKLDCDLVFPGPSRS